MAYSLIEKKGNIVDFEADFIVNASNTNLKLGSGVSMAISKCSGPELQVKLDKLKAESIASNRPILQGDVVATQSFQAKNFDYILHAVIMNYERSVSQQEALPTIETIKDALVGAQEFFRWCSIVTPKADKVTAVFPYLGCGVGRLNKRDVREVFLEFVKTEIDFDCEITLCELD